MNDSIIKLEDCQLDEIYGGVTGKQVAKYAIKGTCKILGGAIAGGLGCILIIKEKKIVPCIVLGGSVGAILGTIGTILGGALNEYLCKKFNIDQ